jgi:hypothetical protein
MIKFPQILGHKYTFHELLDITLLQTKFSTHRRLRVFFHHGTTCINNSCSKEGIYLIKAKNNAGGFHIDLYTENFEMMTIDHIIPKSKGGNNDINNLQPMCNTCNTKKADTI